MQVSVVKLESTGRPAIALEQSLVASEQREHPRPIPSLDGLRAVAIGLVLISHCGEQLTRSFAAGAYFFDIGDAGVSLFFVISGLLITTLLKNEKDKTGKISIKGFYLRRAFRIFPPFYAYLGVVLILRTAGFSESWQSVLAAATYITNYYSPALGGLVFSTWSLSLEEQFYLFWPFCILWMKKARVRWLTIWLIALMPFSRTVSYLLLPQMHAMGKNSMMLFTRVDTFMFGCAIALFWDQKHFQELLRKWLRPWTFYAAVIVALVVVPLLSIYTERTNLASAFHFVRLTSSSAALTWALVYLVKHPASFPGYFVNLAPVKYIGLLSYSLYLYQQIFTGPLMHYFPFNLAGLFAASIASYYLVERPFMRLRARVLDRQQTSYRLPAS
jgi:peptidoglycan/LPS O-acetylase OafA/YrhL